MIASGWGRTVGTDGSSHPNILQEITLNVVDDIECTRAFLDFKMYKQICSRANPGQQICYGDSGAPIVWASSNNQFYIAGVNAAVGTNCVGQLSVQTKITDFLDWIKHQTGNHLSKKHSNRFFGHFYALQISTKHILKYLTIFQKSFQRSGRSKM